MRDSRTKRLAELVVKYCIDVKPNENIIVSGSTEAEDFVEEIYKEIILAKANPLVRIHPKNVNYFFFKHATDKQLKNFPHYWFDVVKRAHACIEIDTEFNPRELSSCDPKKIALRQKTIEPIENYLMNKRDKIINLLVAYPCQAHAIEADMSFDEWKDFVFSTCLIDWKEFSKKLSKVNDLFHKGEEVHLLGEGVDLKFSIKDKNSVMDNGRENMPGGEIFMAPIKKTMNGWIKFDYPTIYNGKEIRDIFLRFKNGKVVEYNSSKNKQTLGIALKIDKNASYVGEFGIGCNPKINRFTNNLLFDEKMNGTVHLALGTAYIENGGGNDSAIHWDLIKDMKKAELILDGKVVQKNGKWKNFKL
jgi:aminopeptidase